MAPSAPKASTKLDFAGEANHTQHSVPKASTKLGFANETSNPQPNLRFKDAPVGFNKPVQNNAFAAQPIAQNVQPLNAMQNAGGMPAQQAAIGVAGAAVGGGVLAGGVAAAVNANNIQKQKHCIKCGNALNGKRFCNKCGTPAAVAGNTVCAKCGNPLNGKRFCNKCGTPAHT
jgi:hypothetical protein